jgi:tRNA dimethylallyltransferase
MARSDTQVSVEARRAVVHHLIDVLEPHENFSAGDFYDLARPITDDILRARCCTASYPWW